MLRTFRDLMIGAVCAAVAFAAVFSGPGRAVLPLPAFNGPYLGDQATNIYTLADAVNKLNQQQATTAVTAFVGGGQTGATALGYGLNQVATVASVADSVMLPPCNVGAVVYVTNDATNSTTVFGSRNRTDTINGTAGATGVAQAGAAHTLYICAVPDATTAATGKWTTIRANS